MQFALTYRGHKIQDMQRAHILQAWAVIKLLCLPNTATWHDYQTVWLPDILTFHHVIGYYHFDLRLVRLLKTVIAHYSHSITHIIQTDGSYCINTCWIVRCLAYRFDLCYVYIPIVGYISKSICQPLVIFGKLTLWINMYV